jgi:hypothetical protein
MLTSIPCDCRYHPYNFVFSARDVTCIELRNRLSESRSSSVGIVTTLQIGISEVRFPAAFFFHNVRTGCGAYTAGSSVECVELYLQCPFAFIECTETVIPFPVLQLSHRCGSSRSAPGFLLHCTTAAVHQPRGTYSARPHK